MDAPKLYKFIGFGAMDAPKLYKFIGFGAMDLSKVRFGNLEKSVWASGWGV